MIVNNILSFALVIYFWEYPGRSKTIMERYLPKHVKMAEGDFYDRSKAAAISAARLFFKGNR
jgi:multimeric flavodoxin WrbA